MKTMFGENLKTLMAERGVSQSELSKMTGIGKPSISQYLSGKNTPSPKNIKTIADALECPIDFFALATRKVTPPELATLKNVSIAEAADRMGKSKQFIRVALQNGIAPFGFAVKVSGDKWSYHISPMKFENYLSGFGK